MGSITVVMKHVHVCTFEQVDESKFVGAHSWVARICQQREQSSSRSWLPIVEGRYPTPILKLSC